MPVPEIQVFPVRSKAERKAFVTFPWKVYGDDPCWVPPLVSDALNMFDRDKNPFLEHAEAQWFLALRAAGGAGRKAGELVGRIAAFVNHTHNEVYRERTGFIGFFECLADPLVPPFLFRTAARWLEERGMERMRGPAQWSGNEEWGLLISGFERPPMVMMTYNPPSYVRYFEDYGFTKAKDVVAYCLDDPNPPARLARMADWVEKRGRITVRTLDMRNYRQEIDRVRDIYNSAWLRNWGFVPMSDKEIDHWAARLKPVVDPELVLFAEAGGRTVAFALALPDLNQALRVLTLGVIPEARLRGADSLLAFHMYRNAVRRGYRFGEFSWILEDNVRMRRGLEDIGAKVYKTYRLYDSVLGS